MTRRSTGVLLLWLMLMTAAVVYILREVRLQTDVSSLLPVGASPAQRALLDQLRSGSTMRLLLLAIEGGTPDQLAAASRVLSDKLHSSGDFIRVANGMDVWSERERAFFLDYRYLLSATTRPEQFSVAGLRSALQQRLQELASPLGVLSKTLLPRDPTGASLALMQAWQPPGAPAKVQGVWVADNPPRALLLAETKVPGYAFAPQQALQMRMQEAFTTCKQEVGANSLRLLSTGPAVFTVQIQQQIERDAWRLSVAATVAVSLFLLLTYRSLTLLLLSLVPLLSAIVMGTVCVNATFGFVHGITLAFGITLLGVVDDYPIHLFTHIDDRTDPQAALRSIWPTLRMGVVTTVIGFGAMVFAPFPGLTHLGLFAVSGLITGALVTRWVLPQIIPAGFRARIPSRNMPDLALMNRGAAVWVPAVVAAACFWLYSSNEPLWERDVDRLTPIPSEAKNLDRTLREAIGAPDVRHLLIAQGATAEMALERSEALGTLLDPHIVAGDLSGYDAPHRYLPSEKTQRARQEALPEPEQLEQALGLAVSALPFKSGLFAPFLSDVTAAKHRPLIGPDTYRDTMFETRLRALLREQDGGWVALLPLYGVQKSAVLQRDFATPGDSAGLFLDLKEESNSMVSEFRNAALRLLAWGALALVVVLAASERDAQRVVRIVLPMLCALVCVAALLHGMHERLSLFHIAAFLLVIGLGLDYALFLNRPHKSAVEFGRTIYGVLICSATTLLVFGVLASSDVPVLRAIGLTAALGSVLSLVFAAALAPRLPSPD